MDLRNALANIPVFTRYYLIITLCFTVLIEMNFINVKTILFFPPLILNRFEIWRLVTSFFYIGRLDFYLLFNIFFLCFFFFFIINFIYFYLTNVTITYTFSTTIIYWQINYYLVKIQSIYWYWTTFSLRRKTNGKIISIYLSSYYCLFIYLFIIYLFNYLII
jgi:hypothetical protein